MCNRFLPVKIKRITTQLLTVLLMVAVLSTSSASVIPSCCLNLTCAFTPSASSGCRIAESMCCCCCSHEASREHSCCKDYQAPKRVCSCHRYPPQPTVPDAPRSADSSRHVSLILSLDTIEPCVKSAAFPSNLSQDELSLSTHSTSLSILYCTWLT